MNFSVTQNGKELDKSKYTWDEKTKTFSTNEDNLVLDFSNINGVTFKTGGDCTFDTGGDCTFNTGYDCTFNTGSDCTFDTGSRCTFDTRSRCTFKTGGDCTFKIGGDCVIVRRDIFEVIIPDTKIKLNGHDVKGYTIVKETRTIVIDGEEIEVV